jgi:hypothetical protein
MLPSKGYILKFITICPYYCTFRILFEEIAFSKLNNDIVLYVYVKLVMFIWFVIGNRLSFMLLDIGFSIPISKTLKLTILIKNILNTLCCESFNLCYINIGHHNIRDLLEVY